MAEIINMGSDPVGLRKSLEEMDRACLIAQQLVQRGAIHAIDALIAAGVTAENAVAMKESLANYLMVIHEVANRKGIILIDYQSPENATNG